MVHWTFYPVMGTTIIGFLIFSCSYLRWAKRMDQLNTDHHQYLKPTPRKGTDYSITESLKEEDTLKQKEYLEMLLVLIEKMNGETCICSEMGLEGINTVPYLYCVIKEGDSRLEMGEHRNRCRECLGLRLGCNEFLDPEYDVELCPGYEKDDTMKYISPCAYLKPMDISVDMALNLHKKYYKEEP